MKDYALYIISIRVRISRQSLAHKAAHPEIYPRAGICMQQFEDIPQVSVHQFALCASLLCIVSLCDQLYMVRCCLALHGAVSPSNAAHCICLLILALLRSAWLCFTQHGRSLSLV